MTTLAADSARPFELGTINELPVIANDIIYEGAAVGDNGSGYMRPLVAGDPFRGFAESKVDNTAVGAAAGDKLVRLRVNGLVKITLSGIAITDVGKPVWASDDDTFTLTQSTNSFIGFIYRYVAANTCIVAFGYEPGAFSVSGAGTTLANGYILAGNGSNVAVAVIPSGDVTMTNTGVNAIGANKVLGTMLGARTLVQKATSAQSLTNGQCLQNVFVQAATGCNLTLPAAGAGNLGADVLIGSLGTVTVICAAGFGGGGAGADTATLAVGEMCKCYSDGTYWYITTVGALG